MISKTAAPSLAIPLAILLVACAPATQPIPSATLPTPAMSFNTPTGVPTQIPAFTETAPPTQVPTQETHPEDRRLGLAEAEKLVRSWYERRGGKFNAALSEEITPEDAWVLLGVQVFRSGEWPFSDSNSTYLIFDQPVWHLGYEAPGVVQTEILLTDLDQNGSSELAYVFAHSGEAARIGVFRILDGKGNLLEMDWLYPGELDLRKGEDGQVWVDERPGGGETVETLGVLSLQGETLSLATDPGQGTMRATYRSSSQGVYFQFPPDWKEVGEGHYQGEDGFFQIYPYVSIASGLSDAYHRLSFRMVRACTWEANAIPGRYGQDPELRLLNDVPGRAQCQITPGAGAQQEGLTLLFETPGGLALLRSDERQMEVIQRTLVYDQPGGRAQPGEEYPYSEAEVRPELELQTSQMGELTLEEYSLFPANEHTPMEEQLARVLADVRAKHDPWRAGPVPDYEPESLEQDNAALAPFGYRLEGFTIESGEQRMRLYRGEALIKDNLSLYPRSLVVEPINQADFALIVEETGVGLWLIRQGSLEPWDIQTHLDSIEVTFVGGRLASYEFEIADPGGALWVTLDGERVYSLYVPWWPLSVQIDSWQDQWALEMDGTLIVGGAIMNLAWGYGEIFEYRLLAGKPFFFYEQGGQVGISYGGRELPVRYDEVIHGECCGGSNNPRFSEQMAWFYARRDGRWYYVEIGRYD